MYGVIVRWSAGAKINHGLVGPFHSERGAQTWAAAQRVPNPAISGVSYVVSEMMLPSDLTGRFPTFGFVDTDGELFNISTERSEGTYE